MPAPRRRARLSRLVVATCAGLVASLLALPAQQAAAAPLGSFSCLPPSGLAQDASPGSDSRAARLYDGYLTLPGYREVFIGTSPSAINWAMDPFGSDTWRKYFTSLKWLELFTKWYQRYPGNTTYQSWMARANAIATDFHANHNPSGARVDSSAAWSPMFAGQRATMYSCLHALGSSSTKSTMSSILSAYGSWLAQPAAAPQGWNQGLDPAIGLLAAGCVTGNASWADLSSSRLGSLSTETIDAQGAVNEQSNGYGNYLWDRFGLAASKLTECGRSVPSTISGRRALLSDFLAWSTAPSGKMVQIGDSYIESPYGDAGSAAEYARARGAAGTAPSVLSKQYDAGYYFMRSSWSGFASSSFAAFRYGPARNFHGHDDHGQITMSAYGEDVLSEGGHLGYAAGAFRDWVRGPFAHNVMTAPGLSFDRYAANPISRSSTGASWKFFETKDQAWYTASTRVKEPRTRGVLLNMEPTIPFAVVWDRLHRSSAGTLQQLWHLPIGSSVALSGRSRAVATMAGGTRLTLFQVAVEPTGLPAGALSSAKGATSPIQGWVGTGDNKKTAAPTVIMSRGTRSASVLTLVVPSPAGAALPSLQVSGSGGTFTITITVGGVTRTVKTTAGGSISRS